VKEDVLTKIENMLRWFGHVEEIDGKTLTKEIYEVVLGDNAPRERPRLTFLDQIGQALDKS
jgi:hypothetical protein